MFVHIYLHEVTFDPAGGEETEACEPRNGAASALLHIDESDVMEKLNRQRSKNKNKKRSEVHHVQTGTLARLLPPPALTPSPWLFVLFCVSQHQMHVALYRLHVKLYLAPCALVSFQVIIIRQYDPSGRDDVN